MDARTAHALGRIASALLLCGAGLRAQPTVAPTSLPLGAARGENAGAFNLLQSFETGYRFRTAGGNLDKYRSDVNYGNGLRLLSSSLALQSRDGKNPYVDQVLLDTLGLGADPYQFASLRAQRNRLYQYDLTWRQNEYFNPALPIAGGLHRQETTHRLQDHTLSLLTGRAVRFTLGYTRNSRFGPALSTANLFGTAGDEFPLFADVDRRQQEFRVGGDVDLPGLRLTWMRGWERYREDAPLLTPAPSLGANPDDRLSLERLRRTEPYRGTTPFWRVALFAGDDRRASVNARFTHSAGRRLFTQEQALLGSARFGAFNRQTLVSGFGRRPVTTGNLTVSAFPTRTLTVTNQSSVHHVRMEGDNLLSEFDNRTLLFSTLAFQYLGIRTLANSTDVQYRPLPWFGVHGGYQASARRIRSVEQESDEFAAGRLSGEQANTLHTGLFGVRVSPVKPLTVNLDAEIGRANRPFYPVSERNYHALSGRAQWRTKALQLTALARTNYNANPTSVTAFSSRSRSYALDASWAASDGVAFDAGYSKLHLDTAGGLSYFLAGEQVAGRSVYVSNLHTGYANVRLALTRRVDVTVGYTRVTDAGGGFAARFLAAGGGPDADGAFRQALPMTFESPLARVSLRLHAKLRWNAGYQHYGYREEPLPAQGYRAHTGFTSLSWSF